MSAAFSMGQYANFVWAAYGISVFGIACVIVWCLRGYSRAKAKLAALEKTAP